jgi:hypothetical protein
VPNNDDIDSTETEKTPPGPPGRLVEGLHLDVPHDVYHADPCKEPSLSASLACTLLGRSPQHALLAHPRLGGAVEDGDDATPARERGSLIHALVLGVGQDFVPVYADNYRTKLAQQARDRARAEGKIPVIAEKLDAARMAAEAIQLQLGTLLGRDWDGGQHEVTAVWRAPGGTLCRARFDRWGGPDAPIRDLKSCENARGASQGSSMLRYGLDVQHAAYTQAVETLYPDREHYPGMQFVFVEVTPPYGVIVAEPDGQMMELGQRKWLRAVETWKRCLADEQWPAYPREVVRVAPPAWALAQDMEEQIANLEPSRDLPF